MNGWNCLTSVPCNASSGLATTLLAVEPFKFTSSQVRNDSNSGHLSMEIPAKVHNLISPFVIGVENCLETRHEARKPVCKKSFFNPGLVSKSKEIQIRCVLCLFSWTLGLFASDGSIHLKLHQVSGALAIGW